MKTITKKLSCFHVMSDDEVLNNSESSAVDTDEGEVASVDNATTEKVEISQSEKLLGDEKEDNSKSRNITKRGVGFTPIEDMMVRLYIFEKIFFLIIYLFIYLCICVPRLTSPLVLPGPGPHSPEKICKSWVEVKKEYSKSKGQYLAEKMLNVYRTYRTQEIETGGSLNALPLRSKKSIFQRFQRVIVPSVIQLHSIVNAQNNDVEKQVNWDSLMKNCNSVARHHFAFKDCYHFLMYVNSNYCISFCGYQFNSSILCVLSFL